MFHSDSFAFGLQLAAPGPLEPGSTRVGGKTLTGTKFGTHGLVDFDAGGAYSYNYTQEILLKGRPEDAAYSTTQGYFILRPVVERDKHRSKLAVTTESTGNGATHIEP
jgi:hypothetical protein